MINRDGWRASGVQCCAHKRHECERTPGVEVGLRAHLLLLELALRIDAAGLELGELSLLTHGAMRSVLCRHAIGERDACAD